MPSPFRLLLGLASYLALVLDPVYYAVIPLINMGGEPELLARLLGISTIRIAGPAIAILVINIMLVRSRVVPKLKP
jgi:hypothetical protein